MQLHQKGVPPAISGQIFGILEACEAAAFTTAEFAYNKQELLLNTKRLLEQVN
jgi:hypothetical protein